MTLLEAILLGAIQGFFMFVPVSSTSHLVLTQQWLIERGSSLPPPDSPELILFDLVVHVGTLVSVAVVFRYSLHKILRGLIREIRDINERQRGEYRYVRLIIMGLGAAATTGAVGLVVLQTGIGVFGMPAVIAFNLFLTGAILWWTDSARGQWRGPGQITPLIAVAIGVAQGVALLPGLSRSGLTIAAALLLGLKRRWAAEFSFFVAIPTIIAGSAVQALLVAVDGEPVLIAPAAFVVGFIVAAVVGTGALLLVLKLLYRARFRIFSLYVWLLAVLVASGILVHV